MQWFLTIRTQGSYRFHTASDDGSLLYLNGERNNNGCHGEQERSSHHMTMAEGSHHLVVEMCEMVGGENFKMRHEGPDTHNSKIAVPASVREHELKFFEPGLECEHFYNQAQCHVPNLGVLTPAHPEVLSNIYMHNGNFPHVRQTDNFCIRCSGYVSINHVGNYRFYTASDDGSLLYLNGKRSRPAATSWWWRCARLVVPRILRCATRDAILVTPRSQCPRRFSYTQSDAASIAQLLF